MRAVPLRAHGLVGDTRSVALVGADGTVDRWPPELSLLDHPDGGSVRVGPAVTGDAPLGRQEWVGESLVLRTVFAAPAGELEVVDCLPADGRLVRVARCVRGRVDVDVSVMPGRRSRRPRRVEAWSGGLAFGRVIARTGCPLVDGRATVELAAGERLVVTVGPAAGDEGPLPEEAALALVEEAATRWRPFVSRVAYDGPHLPALVRSLLVLSALGAPARVEDAATAVTLLHEVGLHDEAAGAAAWLAGTLAETAELLPLTAYADVVDAVEADRAWDGPLAAAGDDLARHASMVADVTGFDSVAGAASAWSAVDRLARLRQSDSPLDLDAAAWRLAAREVAAWVEREGTVGRRYARTPDDDRADAALLRLAWPGRDPHAGDRRGEVTAERELRDLSTGPYVVAVEGDEDAPLDTSFDGVVTLAALDRWEEAHERMDDLVALAGPLVLLPERAEPSTGEWRGELPWAAAHLALVRAGLALATGPR